MIAKELKDLRVKIHLMYIRGTISEEVYKKQMDFYGGINNDGIKFTNAATIAMEETGTSVKEILGSKNLQRVCEFHAKLASMSYLFTPVRQAEMLGLDVQTIYNRMSMYANKTYPIKWLD